MYSVLSAQFFMTAIEQVSSSNNASHFYSVNLNLSRNSFHPDLANVSIAATMGSLFHISPALNTLRFLIRSYFCFTMLFLCT
jgi:hypothetical protein